MDAQLKQFRLCMAIDYVWLQLQNQQLTRDGHNVINHNDNIKNSSKGVFKILKSKLNQRDRQQEIDCNDNVVLVMTTVKM